MGLFVQRVALLRYTWYLEEVVLFVGEVQADSSLNDGNLSPGECPHTVFCYSNRELLDASYLCNCEDLACRL